MAGSRSNSSIPSFSGENFSDWSEKMKEYLISEGLWLCVERCCKKPNQTGGISAAEMEELKQQKVNDGKALSLIHQSLSPTIFMKICDAATAKEAWNTLHSMFPDDSEMRENADESKGETCSEVVKSFDPFEVGIGVLPLSGTKPFFDIVLVKSALRPLCHMNFPERVNSKLPSTNMVAQVKFFGKIYEVYFYGKRKPKAFGAGWRQLLDENEQYMSAGDFLVFEVLESSDSNLEMNMQILRTALPPELEEEIRRRGINPNPVINLDGNDNDGKE